ncbi:MAG: potassium transporter [Bacteroidetes bacterium SW_4_67_19]|nr:MAG: potassium transporter [Bacteroidetes bacterium SW_4_67_19]
MLQFNTALNVNAVVRTLGALAVFLGVALLAPMGVALWYGEPQWWSFGVVAVGALAFGGASWQVLGGPQGRTSDLGVREGFAIVALSWLVLSLVGAAPFVLGGVLESYTDAFFETASGFTTTGATILGGYNPGIEEIPKAFHFWRSLAHWMGGMGIIVLTLAILPILGIGGMQLFKAEVPGPSADKLTPRVRETAKRLWLIYVGLTAAEALLLLPSMTLFDAVNHAFSTMATGGFSPEGGSIADYNSAYVDWIITVFMFFAGMNFALHFRMIAGGRITVFEDTELRVYAAVGGTAAIVIALGTWQPTMEVLPDTYRSEMEFAGYETIPEALRYAAFQAASITTTTGFATADFEVWPPLAKGTLLVLFFGGGMAGSTAGGPKVVRHILLFKNSFKQLKQLVHPQALVPVRLGGQVVSDDVLNGVLSFIVLYFALLGFGIVVMAAMGLDLITSFGATIACLGNIGPGWGDVGATDHYAHIPLLGKWVLSFLMIAGRLEVFTLLVLLAPAFWRR